MPSRNPPAGNNVPVVPLYSYRARRYPWAQRVLAAAEAEHGPPVPTCEHGKPIPDARGRGVRRCPECQVAEQKTAMHWLDYREKPACRPPVPFIATTVAANVTCGACKRTTAYRDEAARLVSARA